MFKDFLKYPYSSKGLSYYIGFLMFVAVFFRGYTGSFILLVGTIITVTLAFFLHYKKSEKSVKPKMVNKPQEPIIVDNSALIKQKAFHQLVSYITFILKSKYPKVTWHFLCPNPREYVITGGWTRLETKNTGDFNCAEIFLSTDGNIKVQMLKVSEFGTLPEESMSDKTKSDKEKDEEKDKGKKNEIEGKIVAEIQEQPQTEPLVTSVNVDTWYQLSAARTLNEIIIELNVKGYEFLYIKADGYMYVATSEGDQRLEQLQNLPNQAYWDEVTNKLIEEGLNAEVKDEKIIVSWA